MNCLKAPITCLVILMCLSACFRCTSANRESPAPVVEETYQSLAIEKYRQNIQYELNKSGTFVLCIHREKTSAGHPIPTLQFFIYDIEQNRILYEESTTSGEVIWIDDFQVRVSLTPEIVADDRNSGDLSYIYDVKQQKIVP